MIPLLDTHQHLIYRDQLGYSWTGDVDALKSGDFTVEDHHRLTEDGGVAGSIFMETGVDEVDYQNEARFVAKLAGNPSNRILGLIATCRPEVNDGFEAWLDECNDLSVVGYRRMLHIVDDNMSKPEPFRANVRKIGARGLPFDICARWDQLAIAYDLAVACPDTRFVINHCGVPDIPMDDFSLWADGVTRLAGLENTVVKLSGVLAYCAQGAATSKAISPYVTHCLEVFGTKRCIWGSDWPVVDTRSTLPDWIDMFRGLTANLSEAEKRDVYHANAEKVYGVTL